MAFNKTSQALSKWDPIVLKNRQAEQLVFPIEKEQSAFAPIEHMLNGWNVSAIQRNHILERDCGVEIAGSTVYLVGHVKLKF